MNLKETIKHLPLIKNIYAIYYNKRKDIVVAEKNKILQEKGYHLLEQVFNDLEKRNYKAVVWYGTMLGMVRDKGFIKHDYDIDIAVLLNEKDEVYKFQQFMKKYNTKHLSQCIYKDVVYEDSYEIDRIRFDFSYFYIDNHEWETVLIHREKTRVYNDGEYSAYLEKPMALTDCIVKENIHGCAINLPENAIDIIVGYYGESWNIPSKEFDWPHARYRTYLDNNGIKLYD